MLSEYDHYERSTKRSNFVNLLLDNYEVDRFIVQHLYGAMDNLNADNSLDEINDVFEKSALNLSTTFA